ncbi:MAG: hypothetical protein QXU87_09385 [Candidatus Caldarchaeum sp.]
MASFFQLLKRVSSLAATFFTFYIIYQLGLSPILSYMGINIPAQAQSISELVGTMAMWLAILSIAMIIVVLGIGYIVFTGWKQRRQIPWPFKLGIAFLLGIIVFMLAAPISMVVRIPLVPTIAAAIILWVALRSLSNYVGPVMTGKTLDEIIRSVKQAHTNVASEPVEVKEAVLVGRTWKIKIAYRVNGQERLAEYEVDADSGEVKRWRAV